jgi:hypothetical protein
MRGIANPVHRHFRLEFTITLRTPYQTMDCIVVLEGYVRIEFGTIG